MLALQDVAADPPPPSYVPALLLLVLWTFVWYFISTFLRKRLEALPAESRMIAPWTTYFLMIPGVNVFANFFVLIGTSQAYLASFTAMGRELPTRESGRVEAAAYGALFCLGIYPVAPSFQGFIWVIAITLIVIYLLKIHSLGLRFARIQVDA